MSHSVQLSLLAIDDLIALNQWIAAEADPVTAAAYIDRIEQRVTAIRVS